MSLKRVSDALVAMPDTKRSRSELVAITNRDKALLEAVSKNFVRIAELQCFKTEIKPFAGCEENIEFIRTDYAIGGT